VKFLDVAKFTAVTPLSLVILCKLSFPVVGLKMSSFPVVGLKMSSLPTLALKSNEVFVWYLGNYQTRIQVPCRSCPSHRQFYALLGHERS
jgi:hypothetical protein